MSFRSTMRLMGFIFLITISFMFIGCSDDIDNERIKPEVFVGYFIDEEVEGLAYSCDNLSGETDEFGRFNYYEGKNVTFSVGDIVLGSSVGKTVVTPLDIVDNTLDSYTNTVINICNFLHNIDEDNSPGIKIKEEVKLAAKDKTIDFSSATIETADLGFNFYKFVDESFMYSLNLNKEEHYQSLDQELLFSPKKLQLKNNYTNEDFEVKIIVKDYVEIVELEVTSQNYNIVVSHVEPNNEEEEEEEEEDIEPGTGEFIVYLRSTLQDGEYPLLIRYKLLEDTEYKEIYYYIVIKADPTKSKIKDDILVTKR